MEGRERIDSDWHLDIEDLDAQICAIGLSFAGGGRPRRVFPAWGGAAGRLRLQVLSIHVVSFGELRRLLSPAYTR